MNKIDKYNKYNIQDLVTLVFVSWKNPSAITKKLRKFATKPQLINQVVIAYNGKKAGNPLNHKKVCHPSWDFKFIQYEKNKGFAPVINECSILVGSKYMLIMNDDADISITVIQQLTRKIEYLLDIGIQIGIATPVILDPDTGKLLHAGWKLNFKTGRLKAIRDIKDIEMFESEFIFSDSVSGEIALIPIDIFRKMGGFYSKFFAYWEETEYSIRLKKNGIRSVVVSTSIGFHKVSQSIGDNTPIKFYLLFRNKLWVFLYLHRDKVNLPIFIVRYIFDFFIKFLSLVKRGRISNLVPLALIDGFLHFHHPITEPIRELMIN